MRPTVQITLGLVLLTSLVLLVVDLMLGVFPDPEMQELRLRSVYGQSVASESAALLRAGDAKGLDATLERAVQDDPRLLGIAVRTADAKLVASAGTLGPAGSGAGSGPSTLGHVSVPLSVGSARWGEVDLYYAAEERSWLARTIGHPRLAAIAGVALLGTLMYWLYLRRALAQLDPSSVIPERVRVASDVMTEGVVMLDARERILLANRAFCGIARDAAGDLVGKRLSELDWLHGGTEAGDQPWARAMRSAEPAMEYAVEAQAPDGSSRKLIVNCAPIADASGAVRGCIATFSDRTALHFANEQLSAALDELHTSRDEIQQKSVELEYLARHDTLTGCLNRRAFHERIASAWRDARRDRVPLACLALDIDQFKTVNDSHGHATGDRVIQAVGGVLLRTLRASDIVGRHGGDEFLVGMPGCDLATALAVAEKLRKAVEEQCGLADGEGGRHVTVSIGCAASHDANADLSELIEAADQALYRAKAQGRNRVAAATEAAASRAQSGLSASPA